jgi:hypothetical protein
MKESWEAETFRENREAVDLVVNLEYTSKGENDSR